MIQTLQSLAFVFSFQEDFAEHCPRSTQCVVLNSETQLRQDVRVLYVVFKCYHYFKICISFALLPTQFLVVAHVYFIFV